MAIKVVVETTEMRHEAFRMDVTCTSCGVVYEFDDEQVTPRGVTVKCTDCGHVFKVTREDADAEPSVVDRAPSQWMVRSKDGKKTRFKELTTLQRWIVEQKVSRDDEISKTGKSWKQLGEITELESFFDVVDAANQAQSVDNVISSALAEGSNHPMSAPTPATDSTFLPMAEYDVDEFAPRKGRGGLIALIVAVLIVGGGMAAYAVAPDAFSPLLISLGVKQAEQIKPALPSFSDVHIALKSESVTTLDALIDRIGTPADDVGRGILARLWIAKARIADDEVRLSPDRAAAKVARDKALGKIDELLTGTTAVPATKWANIARGTFFSSWPASKTREELLQIGPDAIWVAEANTLPGLAALRGPLTAQIPAPLLVTKLLASLPEDPTDRRLTFISLAGRYSNGDAAKLSVLSSTFGNDGRISALRERVQRAKKTVEKAPAKRAHDVDNDNESFDSLMKKAERSRMSDRTKAAVGLYKRALAKRPGNSEAHAGLGWAYLDLDKAKAAVREFRTAASSSPSNAEAQFGMGEAYVTLRDYPKAIAAYEKYLDLNPGGADAAHAKRAIEKLEGM